MPPLPGTMRLDCRYSESPPVEVDNVWQLCLTTPSGDGYVLSVDGSGRLYISTDSLAMMTIKGFV